MIVILSWTGQEDIQIEGDLAGGPLVFDDRQQAREYIRDLTRSWPLRNFQVVTLEEPHDPEWISIDQMAGLFNISRATMLRWIARGYLTGVPMKIGTRRKHLYLRVAILATRQWMERGRAEQDKKGDMMNWNEVKEFLIGKTVFWDRKPSDYAGTINIESDADFQRLKEEMKANTGCFFYIDVWNCQARLALYKDLGTGNGNTHIIENSPLSEENMEKDVYAVGGAINISGWYPLSKKLITQLREALGEKRKEDAP